MFRSRLFRRAFFIIIVMVVLHTVSLLLLTVPYIRERTIRNEALAAQAQLDFAYDFLLAEHSTLLKDRTSEESAEDKAAHEKLLVDSLHTLLQGKRVAGSGYFFVFRGNGNMLVHPDPELEGSNISKLPNPATGRAIRNDLIAAAHTPSHRLDYIWDRPTERGRFVHKKIAWVRYFDEHDIYLVASVYLADLRTPGEAILTRILGASLLILVIFIPIIIFLIREHQRPIRELALTSERVAGGDLSARCVVRRNDEIGTMARAFNHMVDQVRANIHDLDSKVNERTRELGAANRELTASVQRLKKTQEQLVESEQRAREASKAKSAFVAAMSHEFRTPLNAIIGYSEMLEEECEDSGYEELVEDLTKIQTAGKQLLELVDDVLDLSKVEAGRMEFVIERFSIRDLVNQCRSSVEPQAEANGDRLVINCPSAVGEMTSDRVRVRQILLNILSNACKFTENGTVKLTVSRIEEAGREWVDFCVNDTGIGMTAEQLGNLFQAFKQGDASVSRAYGGTGLGLDLSRRLCRQLGGDINATSSAGEGSTFTARLPVIAPQAPNEERAEPEPVESASPADALAEDLPKVLVVEDDEGVRSVLRRFFEGAPVDLHMATDGQEGLRMARELRPDAITLDVVMPRMDGWSVLRELRADPDLAETPVMLVTVDPNRERGYALGATEYLTKPLDPQQLVDAVLRHLNRKRTDK